MAKTEKAIFTNLCMVYDGEGNILVQDRKNPNWKGITFPGGHVEEGESFTESVIREVWEETGLNIPKVLEVTMIDGKWAIVSEYIKGKTLAQLMEEDVDKKDEYLELFVNLQIEVHPFCISFSHCPNTYIGQK